jgi:hypothetical protein
VEDVEQNPLTVVVISQTLLLESFPNPLRLKPNQRVMWHCNPRTGTDLDMFTVEFSDSNPFDITGAEGKVGGSTPILTVLPEAKPGSYDYHINVGGIIHDPEIIIEEAVPEPRAARAHAAR